MAKKDVKSDDAALAVEIAKQSGLSQNAALRSVYALKALGYEINKATKKSPSTLRNADKAEVATKAG